MLMVLLLGVLIGVVLGLTGAGGGILGVPALVAGLGWSMQQAAPVALVAVACSSAVGAFEGWRRGLVRYRASLLMALAGVPFSSLGLWIAHQASQVWLTGLFAVAMLLAAGRMWRRHDELERPSPGWARINPETGRFNWNLATAGLLGSIGALTGLLTGLLGVGGGFVIVPALRRFTNLSMHGVVATSLLTIALVGSGSVLSALAHGISMPAGITLGFAAATALGALGGRWLSRRWSQAQVQRGFALVLMAVALGMLAKTAMLVG